MAINLVGKFFAILLITVLSLLLPAKTAAATCTLSAPNSFPAGQNVQFTLSNLEAGVTYVVTLYTTLIVVGGPVTHIPLDSKTYTVTDPAQTITDSFDGSLIGPNAGQVYSVEATVGAIGGPVCGGQAGLVPTPGAPISGENPCPGGNCTTAIGTFSSDPQAFVGQVLTIAIGLAGGIAFILMVIGAIRVLTSTGNPQNVNAGRDMIVAALAGLIFIILSVLILKFIGVNIFGGGLNPFS